MKRETTAIAVKPFLPFWLRSQAMKRFLNWLQRSFSSSAKRPRPAFRPRFDCLEEREVPNATSWADGYHRAIISAIQSPADYHVAFAIDETHHLTEFYGASSKAYPGAAKGAIDGGFASDIDTGLDFAGNAQVLVHGMGNRLGLYNVVSGWTDITFKSRYGDKVWQISAGNNGELYMLDTAHLVWKFESSTDFGSTGGWRLLGVTVSEIQASRNRFDSGFYARMDSGSIVHFDSSVWTVLGTNLHAKALSVNANNSVFIIAGADGAVYKYISINLSGWSDTTGRGVQAINACTGLNNEDLVYAFVGPSAPGDIHGYVSVHEFNRLGLGPDPTVAGTVWTFTWASGWHDLGIYSDEFSGVSGSTLYDGVRYSDSLYLNVYRDDLAAGTTTFLGLAWSG
jgi:hypothetical protein